MTATLVDLILMLKQSRYTHKIAVYIIADNYCACFWMKFKGHTKALHKKPDLSRPGFMISIFTYNKSLNSIFSRTNRILMQNRNKFSIFNSGLSGLPLLVRMFQDNRVIPVRSHRNNMDIGFGKFSDAIEVASGVGGEILELP
jgi:hypothetical protein